MTDVVCCWVAKLALYASWESVWGWYPRYGRSTRAGRDSQQGRRVHALVVVTRPLQMENVDARPLNVLGTLGGPTLR